MRMNRIQQASTDSVVQASEHAETLFLHHDTPVLALRSLTEGKPRLIVAASVVNAARQSRCAQTVDILQSMTHTPDCCARDLHQRSTLGQWNSLPLLLNSRVF